MRFEVLIPVYNREKELGNLLEILLGSKESEMRSDQVIISDDGSTDDTRYVARFYSCRLVEGQHTGLVGAFNRGLHATEGKIVVYLDSDIEPESWRSVDILAGMLNEAEGVAIAQGVVLTSESRGQTFTYKIKGRNVKVDARVVYGAGLRFGRSDCAIVSPDYFLFNWQPLSEIPHWDWMPILAAGWAYAFRANIVKQLGGMDKALTPGHLLPHADLSFRLREKGWKLRLTKRAIFYHPTSLIKEEGDFTLEDEKVEYFRERWENTGIFSKSSFNGEIDRRVVKVLKGGL